METTTAPATYTAGMTRYGSKVHRIEGRRTSCDANQRNENRRNTIRFVVDLTADELPAGVLCIKCFPNVDAARVSATASLAPVAPVGARAPKQIAQVTLREAAAKIAAAGFADRLSSRYTDEPDALMPVATVKALIESYKNYPTA